MPSSFAAESPTPSKVGRRIRHVVLGAMLFASQGLLVSCASFGTRSPEPGDDAQAIPDASPEASLEDASFDAGTDRATDGGSTTRCTSTPTPGLYPTAEACRNQSTSDCIESPLPAAGSPCAFTGTRVSCACPVDTAGTYQRIVTSCRCE